MGKWSDFEDYMAKTMEQNHIVGAAVAVADSGHVLYAKGFGVKDLRSREPVTPATVFGIASVSKSFTSMAMMQLADKGEISLDDPVVKHIPEFKLVGEEDMDDVKIRHILSHTSGLPPVKRREEIKQFEDHLRYLAAGGYRLLGKPGEFFSYSNDSFLLNGLIIQRKSGRIFRRHMTLNILDAIGMNRSTYNLEELEKLGDVSTPYTYNKKSGQHEEQPWPKLGTYEVGGGVRSCVLDLMKYGQVYLNEGALPDGTRIVSKAGASAIWKTPMYKVGRLANYCLALEATQNYAGLGVTLVEHGGSQPGVSSHFGFVPEKGVTVAVLTNVGGVPSRAIWLALVNAAIGLPLDTKDTVESEWAAPEGYLSRFVGTYESAEDGDIVIEMGDSILQLKTPEGDTFRLVPSDAETLFYTDSGQQNVLRFYFAGEKPWAVLFHKRMLRKVSGETV